MLSMQRWTLSQVSNVFEMGNRYVIALLTEVREEGIAPMEQVRVNIELDIMKEKKAEKLMEEMKAKNASSLEDLAAEFGTDVRTATDISFKMVNLPASGPEPAVVGTALNIEEGKLYGPVKGTSGVFMLKVTAVTEAPEKQNYSMEKTSLVAAFANRAGYQVFEAIKEKAEIEDQRSKFF